MMLNPDQETQTSSCSTAEAHRTRVWGFCQEVMPFCAKYSVCFELRRWERKGRLCGGAEKEEDSDAACTHPRHATDAHRGYKAFSRAPLAELTKSS